MLARVTADLPTPPDIRTVDVERYAELLRRAVETVTGWMETDRNMLW